MGKNNKHNWIITACNTKYSSTHIEMFRGTVHQAEQKLLGLAFNDMNADEEHFKRGVEDFGGKCQKTIYDAISGEVLELNAYNVFSVYRIIYSAQRVDKLKRKEQEHG